MPFFVTLPERRKLSIVVIENKWDTCWISAIPGARMALGMPSTNWKNIAFGIVVVGCGDDQ